MKALIVDDCPVVCEVIEDFLNVIDPDIQVFSAEEGGHAVRLLCEEKPNLVLLDFSMPVVTGEAFMKALNNLKNTIDSSEIFSPYVYCITGDANDVRERMLLLGVHDVLPKPLSLEVLNSIITKMGVVGNSA